MGKIDPRMAARVWERVQAGKPQEVPPAGGKIPVVRVPPEAWKEAPARPARRLPANRKAACGGSLWPLLVLLIVLTGGNNG